MIGGEWKWAGGDRQNAPLVWFRAVSCSRWRHLGSHITAFASAVAANLPLATGKSESIAVVKGGQSAQPNHNQPVPTCDFRQGAFWEIRS